MSLPEEVEDRASGTSRSVTGQMSRTSDGVEKLPCSPALGPALAGRRRQRRALDGRVHRARRGHDPGKVPGVMRTEGGSHERSGGGVVWPGSVHRGSRGRSGRSRHRSRHGSRRRSARSRIQKVLLVVLVLGASLGTGYLMSFCEPSPEQTE